MLKQIYTGLAALALVGCATVAQPPSAAAQGTVPNVLVMGEDADQDTVPRNSRVFRQVLQEIQSEFNAAGYRYYDETALGGDYFVEGRTRRPKSEVMKICQTMSPTMDVAVLFHIYASTKKLDFMTEARMRVEGEMIDCQSAQGLGNFEVSALNTFKLPVDCSRECMLEEMSKEARPLGRDLANALVAQINQRWITPRRSGAATTAGTGGATAPIARQESQEEAGFVRLYGLCFDGFTQSDMIDLEEYLVVFGGYQSHRVTSTSATRTCYQYESSSAQSKLTRNLVRMIDHAGMQGQLTGAGTSFTMTKIPTIKRHPLDRKDWN